MRRTEWTVTDWRDFYHTIEKFKRRVIARHAAKQGESMSEQAKCSSCGAAIIWAVMPSGKRMPLDAEPDQGKGCIRVIPLGDGSVRGEILKDVELQDAATALVPLFVSHFATCPNAKAHRKPK